MGKEIGIDLGTTNTIVSYIDKKNRLKSLKINKKQVTPSAVFFDTEDEWTIGTEAKNKMQTNVNAGVLNFKTTIGDKSRKVIIAEDGSKFKLSSKEITKCFLNSIIKGVEEKLIKEFGPEEGVIENVVITVPAKFSSTEKEATKWAAIEAGFKNVKLVAEPTAAAVAHQRENGDEGKNILVYDFGGGTFDVSILYEKNGVFNEVVTGGDKTLGGNKITQMIVEKILSSIEDDYDLEMPLLEEDYDEDEFEIDEQSYKKNMSHIIEMVNEFKEKISSEDESEIILDIILPDKSAEMYEEVFKREEVEKMIYKEIKRTVEITKNVIEEAKNYNIDKIDEIVLAGGSSQIPLVKQLLEEELEVPISFADDVSTLISNGAAILAKEGYSNGLEAIAKTNVELGIDAIQGQRYNMFETIIGINEELPHKAVKKFMLKEDNQDRIEIRIYERDIKNYPKSKRIFDNGVEEIDSLIIDNLPKNLKKDETDVKVTFNAQIDGSLSVGVELIDRKTNKSIKDSNMKINKASNLE